MPHPTQELDPFATPRLADPAEAEGDSGPRWGTAHFGPQFILRLRPAGAQEAVVLRGLDARGLVLGRVTPDADPPPDVDLTAYSSMTLGVSRRHARLARQQDQLYVTDLGSANGTSLSGRRLESNMPRLLRDGDELQLGLLRLHITFEEDSSQPQQG